VAARPAPQLSKERIRATALQLIDAEGLAGLSMRKLAGELGVSAPSLYFHYATKDDLIDDIASEIVEEVDTSAFDRGWQEGVLVWARSYRAALGRHPNIVPFLAHGPGLRETSLRNSNNVHAGLVAGGWPDREATMIGASTKYLVVGSAMGSFSRGFVDDAALYADRFPALRGAHKLRQHADRVDRDAFEFALTTFVNGLVVRLEALQG
jgi:AcrR family transcriptional regulator